MTGRPPFRAPTLVGLGVALCAGSGAAQAPDSVPLFGDRLGTYSRPITTSSPTAQAYFDQGLRLMYAYTPPDALRSFRAARAADPACAMCWWGEAWALGPYFNGAMRPGDAPAAYEAAQQARSLSPAASAVEQALIAALGTRYVPEHPAGGRRGLDSAFAAAMATVYQRFPDDVDVATVYADALMLLEPRRGVWPIDKPAVQRIHAVLETALARKLAHPGACHAYVHATETTPKVGAAQRCADLLGASIPGASHINHMPSHTYNRVGRWGDATRANIDAVQTDRRAATGDGFAIYPAHNLHMLLFSASVDGQSAVALQAARDYTRMVGDDGASFQALVLVRFGRFDEVLELARPPQHPIHRGLWVFGRGLAHLRLGAADSAHSYLARVDSLAAHTPTAYVFRQHRADQLLGVVAGILRGEILRTAGRHDEAIQALERAVHLEAGLTYDEPEPLPFSARDFLGALLLDLHRYADAHRVFERALDARPHNGWSLIGLEHALRAQGRATEARQVRDRFEQAWVRSDIWLSAPRFD